MNYVKLVISVLFFSAVIGGMNMEASAFLGLGNSVSWKEEVLLHDGQKIIVERSVVRKGRHEIGQKPPIREQSLTFTPPGSRQQITWKSEYTEDVGYANFGLRALDIVDGTPYIVSSLIGCLSYNKWGRPNPPYIIFKYSDHKWEMVPLSELPPTIKRANVILYLDDEEIRSAAKQLGYITADSIRELNSSLKLEYQNTIVRTPLPPGSAGVSCPEEFYNGNGSWYGAGWFTSKSSYQACLDVCNMQKFREEYCPCNKLFKGRK